MTNFPAAYAGNANNVGVGNPFATYGIWNAASYMSISFQQKFDQVDLQFRQPIIEESAYRWYAILGGRMAYIRERFNWVTVDSDVSGTSTPDTIADYKNNVFNQMYGPKLGWGNEYYLGHGFALTIDLDGALMIDIVKESASYQLSCGCADDPIAARDKMTFTIVPEVEAKLNIWWYPIEGVQVRIGYDAMYFMNTVSARHPVAFNFNDFEPAYSRAARFFQGFNIGIGVSF